MVSAWWSRRSSTAEVMVLFAVEDGGPLFEGFVGGKDDGAAFVTLAGDLEEKVGSALVNGEVTDLVEHEDRG
jgi:hypothetical protein